MPEPARKPDALPWIVAGAILGGWVVGPFRLTPFWLWGVLGGVAGGLLGLMAAAVWRRPGPAIWRGLAAALILGCGLFALWLVAGRQWVLEETRRALGG